MSDTDFPYHRTGKMEVALIYRIFSKRKVHKYPRLFSKINQSANLIYNWIFTMYAKVQKVSIRIYYIIYCYLSEFILCFTHDLWFSPDMGPRSNVSTF